MLLDTNASQIVGALAGLLMTLALLPQLIKVYKTKSAKDLSLLTYLFYAAGVFIWMFYGLSINDWIITVFKGIGFLLSVGILIGIWMYQKK